MTPKVPNTNNWTLRKILFLAVVIGLVALWGLLSFRLSRSGLGTGSMLHILGAWATSGLPGIVLVGMGIRGIFSKLDVGPSELVVVMPGTGPLVRRRLRDPSIDRMFDDGSRILGIWMVSVGLLILIPPLTMTGILLLR